MTTVEFTTTFGNNQLLIVATVSPGEAAISTGPYTQPASGPAVELVNCLLQVGDHYTPFMPHGLGIWDQRRNRYDSLMRLIDEDAVQSANDQSGIAI